MIFGLLAIFCWAFLLCLVIAFVILAIRRNGAATVVLSAFLFGGISAGTLIWQATRPEGLPLRESLRAGLTDAGLREYGHPIEHRAEVAICFSTYACVLGGCLFAGATFLGIKVLVRRRVA